MADQEHKSILTYQPPKGIGAPENRVGGVRDYVIGTEHKYQVEQVDLQNEYPAEKAKVSAGVENKVSAVFETRIEPANVERYIAAQQALKGSEPDHEMEHTLR